MLVAIPLGQTHDTNPANEKIAGGEDATEWSGIDPEGAHAIATAVAWAGPVPEVSVTPNHPSVRSVPLKTLGDRTIWLGTCDLYVRRDECSGDIVYIGEPIKKKAPLRIEVRRVKKKYSDAIQIGLTAGMLTALAAMDMPGMDGVTEAIVDGALVGLGTGSLPLLLPDIQGNEINRGVDEDGNSAYLDAELHHHSANGRIIYSHGSAAGTFAGDGFDVWRASHTHGEFDLHPER